MFDSYIHVKAARRSQRKLEILNSLPKLCNSTQLMATTEFPGEGVGVRHFRKRTKSQNTAE